VRRSVGAFGFREWTGGFQGGWTGNGDGRLTDILHLFEFSGKGFLKVGAFVLLKIICQETETCHGSNHCDGGISEQDEGYDRVRSEGGVSDGESEYGSLQATQ